MKSLLYKFKIWILPLFYSFTKHAKIPKNKTGTLKIVIDYTIKPSTKSLI